VKKLDSSGSGFADELHQLTRWSSSVDPEVVAAVDEIVDAIIGDGDTSLLRYTRTFDGIEADTVADLEVSPQQLQQALESIDTQQRALLESAAQRIREFHEHQLPESWNYHDGHGSLLGQQITALERVGLYVPGGKASYPSSVLMNAIPARVAGVGEVVMAVPAPGGIRNELVLAAAAIAGVDRMFTMGGAQAIAALAYGTQTVPRVDKIMGPGNIYVATAKRRVFGQVGIDMIAGPSEILVICDGSVDPDWIAMDLFSQAEHDEQAQAILLSPDAAFLDRVSASMANLLPQMQRRDLIEASLSNRGAMIKTRDIAEAVEISNQIAPEHLELCVEDPEQWLPRVRHAGAIFMGPWTPEALGDYCAGPNHVLPTSGTARFSSPLGVYDFIKRSSVIMCTARGMRELGPVASGLARGESLEAHARSAEMRLQAARD
jgi:histidinol dehydrogenase